MFKPNLIGSGFRIQVIVSGKKTDKSGVFETFYGELKYAPMIKECPITMECKLYDTYDTPTHDFFIGEIVETYADESVLTNEKVDITKVKPLLFDMSSIKYWSIGEVIANCWNVGKQMKKRPKFYQIDSPDGIGYRPK